MFIFPRWREVLRATESDPGVVQSSEITLRWYLGWCRKEGTGADLDSARAFVAWAEAEKRASAWAEERWKEALNWFFAAAGGEVVRRQGR